MRKSYGRHWGYFQPMGLDPVTDQMREAASQAQDVIKTHLKDTWFRLAKYQADKKVADFKFQLMSNNLTSLYNQIWAQITQYFYDKSLDSNLAVYVSYTLENPIRPMYGAQGSILFDQNYQPISLDQGAEFLKQYYADKSVPQSSDYDSSIYTIYYQYVIPVEKAFSDKGIDFWLWWLPYAKEVQLAVLDYKISSDDVATLQNVVGITNSDLEQVKAQIQNLKDQYASSIPDFQFKSF